MRDRQGDFEKARARLAVVGLADRAHARAFREESGITFPLFVDERRRAYRAARLRSASPLDLVKPANLAGGLRAMRAGHRQHRSGAHPFQLGGSFVFAPGDVDRFAHWSETFSDNAPPERLLEAVRG